MKKFIRYLISEWGSIVFLMCCLIVALSFAYGIFRASALKIQQRQPAIIIKMDYETVKRIDARLDAIDGVLTINGLIPAK